MLRTSSKYIRVAPSFMSDVFGMKQNVNSENVSANTRSDKTFYCSLNTITVNNGVETLSFLGPKIWDMIPSDMKNSSSVPLFNEVYYYKYSQPRIIIHTPIRVSITSSPRPTTLEENIL